MSKEFLGYKIDNLSFSDALEKATGFMQNCMAVTQVVTINPEMYECASKDKEFAQILKDAELIIPDGVGVKIGLLLNGIKTDRIPGVDFAWALLEFCAEKNIPVAIIGAKEDVITTAVKNLNEKIKGLNIVYFHNGYFDNDYEIYEHIKDCNAALTLVAMGSPRQEKFIYGAKKVLHKGLMVGIGGSLDVWSGAVKRAPLLFRKTGTEWLYRTLSQPSRIKRIFPALPLFALKALKYRFFK